MMPPHVPPILHPGQLYLKLLKKYLLPLPTAYQGQVPTAISVAADLLLFSLPPVAL
jgi:hypothetical protein